MDIGSQERLAQIFVDGFPDPGHHELDHGPHSYDELSDAIARGVCHIKKYGGSLGI